MGILLKFLRITLALGIALAILYAGFKIIFMAKKMCLSIGSTGICNAASTLLSALLFFFVAYCTLLWIDKIRKGKTSIS